MAPHTIKMAEGPNPIQYVKYIIARAYFDDSFTFLIRYQTLKQAPAYRSDRSYRAKAIVDLMMGIECALKSTLISISDIKEPPNVAFKRIRSFSHDLEQLLGEYKLSVKRSELVKRSLKIFRELKLLDVKSRYMHEVWRTRMKAYTPKYEFELDFIAKTIDSGKWCTSVQKLAIEWHKKCDKALQTRLHPYAVVLLSDSLKMEKHINNYLANLPKK